VAEEIEDGVWPKVWLRPSKRTVDRRVNECADPRFADMDVGFPKLMCVKAGWYQPNPHLFDEEVRHDVVKAGSTR
jgi:hypothetical protein